MPWEARRSPEVAAASVAKCALHDAKVALPAGLYGELSAQSCSKHEFRLRSASAHRDAPARRVAAPGAQSRKIRTACRPLGPLQRDSNSNVGGGSDSWRTGKKSGPGEI